MVKVLSSLVVKEMVLGLHHPRTALIVKVPTVQLISIQWTFHVDRK